MTLAIRVVKQVQRKSLQCPVLNWFSTDNSALRKGPECKEECKWLCGSSQEILSAVRGQVEVRQNFISEEEESAIFKEIEPGLRKKRYEFDHWDDVSNTTIRVSSNIHNKKHTRVVTVVYDCYSTFVLPLVVVGHG